MINWEKRDEELMQRKSYRSTGAIHTDPENDKYLLEMSGDYR